MKKRLFALCAGVVLTLCSCSKKPCDTPYFHIDGELPDIGEYSGKLHLFDENVDESFRPCDDYGLILPFVGRAKPYLSDYGMEQTYYTYGFVDSEGRVVMLPSDNTENISYNESADGFGYYTVMLKIENEEEMTPTDSILIPSSGAWMRKIPAWSYVAGAGDGVITIMTGGGVKDGEYTPSRMLIALDYDGKEIFTIEEVEYCGGFSSGLLNINTQNGGYYVDTSGSRVLDGFSSTTAFAEDGVAAVEYEDLGWCLIDKDGRVLSDYYDTIGSAGHGFYEGKTDDSMHLITSDGKIQRRIGGKNSYVEIIPTKDGYVYRDGQEYRRLSDDSVLKSEETGQMPNMHISNDYFVRQNHDDGYAIVFDYYGKTVAKIQDFLYISGINNGLMAYVTRHTDGEDRQPTQTLNLIDLDTGEVIFATDTDGFASFADDGRYVIFYLYKAEGAFSTSATSYLVYDTEKREFLFDSEMSYVRIINVDDRNYFITSNDSVCTLYDDMLSPILTVINE